MTRGEPSGEAGAPQLAGPCPESALWGPLPFQSCPPAQQHPVTKQVNLKQAPPTLVRIPRRDQRLLALESWPLGLCGATQGFGAGTPLAWRLQASHRPQRRRSHGVGLAGNLASVATCF